MPHFDCPHCLRPEIPVAQKLWIGPGLSSACRRCGRQVGVALGAIAAGTPFAFAYAAMPFVESVTAVAGLFLAGAAVTAALHLRFVPLVAKD